MLKGEIHIIPREVMVAEGSDPTGQLDLLFIVARDPAVGNEFNTVTIGLDRETAKKIGERLSSPSIEIVRDIASILPPSDGGNSAI